MEKITPREFLDRMIEIKHDFAGDTEAIHISMDSLMCQVLREQGFGMGVDVFENTDVWYA